MKYFIFFDETYKDDISCVDSHRTSKVEAFEETTGIPLFGQHVEGKPSKTSALQVNKLLVQIKPQKMRC